MSSLGGPAAVGEIIAGRYRIDAWLGQGAMAAVYRATHLGTGQPSAVKLVLPQLVERTEIRDLFVQEARVGARIGKNPYIVDVFDAGIDQERGVPFLAMELLEGDTLDRYVKQRGPLPPGLMRTLFLQLADALGQAHAAGVVHRDLKPGNLFLTYDRKKTPLLKVVDFGIAKVIEEGIQGTATQVGSPAYAAPEQLGSAMRPMAAKMGVVIAHGITPQTDIWALGLLAYELLLGTPPGHLWTGGERGTIADIMMAVAINPTPSAVARAGSKAHLLPRGFDEWLDRCLRKNATERWHNVEEAARQLASLLDLGYDDGETQQIQPNVLLGLSKANAMRKTLPFSAMAGHSPQPGVQTAVLPPGLYPAVPAEAPPLVSPPPTTEPAPNLARPPLPSESPHLPPERHPFSSSTGSSPSVSRLPMGSVPQSADTTHGLSGTQRPAAPSRSIAALVVGAVALLAALGLGVFVMLPKKGGFKIDVTGANSMKVAISVDGMHYCDTTPCIVRSLEPGERVIHVRGPGDIEATVKATVERGEETSVVVPLGGAKAEADKVTSGEETKPKETAQPEPPSVEPGPPQALETTPTPAPIESGRPTGPMPTVASTSSTPAGETTRGSGTLNINSIPVSKVVLDGRPLGNTPKVGLSVPAGSHTVVFVHPDKGKKTLTVMVSAGESKTAAVKF